MKLCSEGCIPCCDYCKYVVHREIKFENNKVLGAPIFCKLHSDKEHTQLVRLCSYCKDFWCMDSDKDIVAVELSEFERPTNAMNATRNGRPNATLATKKAKSSARPQSWCYVEQEG